MAVMLDTPWAGVTFTPPTPLDIATIEAAIVSQLSDQINAIEVTHYPDRPESYRLTHRVGAALVRFEGAAYGELIDTAAVVQKRTISFTIRLMVRELGWSFGGDAAGPSPGAYALLEAMRNALTGFQIGGCSKIYPVNGGASDHRRLPATGQSVRARNKRADHSRCRRRAICVRTGGRNPTHFR
jgi:hypothetical protein